MSCLTIGIDFITGRCVAASVSDRDRPEWPPHPGRLYMAMAAAVFETGENPEHVAALQWLETLPPPEIHASEASARSTVKYYVPVNDKMTVNTSILQSTPGLSRSKQERSYPTTIPLDTNVLYVWRNAVGIESHHDAILAICSNVIRIGHSSSFVRAWALMNQDDLQRTFTEKLHWEPSNKSPHLRVRIAGPGEFDRLRLACNASMIEEFSELKREIESTQGKTHKDAKRRFEQLFGKPYGRNLRPPEPTPATLGQWQGYQQVKSGNTDSQIIIGQNFDSELLILTKLEGRSIGARDTLFLTSRLRKAVMSQCPINPTPEWLGGHEPTTGKPSELPHAAFLALPYVSRDYADGHVMGLAIAFPNREVVSPAERGRLLGSMFYLSNGEARDIELTLGKLGVWRLRLEERPDPPVTLQAATWIGPSKTWASVTPVVLDRFTKVSLEEDRQAWQSEVCRTVTDSCARAGLPRPIEVDVETTCWHLGAPRAYCKSRPLRSEKVNERRATLGNGFPLIPGRQGKPPRPQVHVFLRFAQAVQGPVLIGAGRFLGYGLCKPIRLGREMQ